MPVGPGEIAVWLATVTAFGQTLKAWFEARKAQLDLKKNQRAEGRSPISTQEVAADVAIAAAQGVRTTATHRRAAKSVVIPNALLVAFQKDIDAAVARFAASINDPRLSASEVDREQARAEAVVRIHIANIKKYNGGVLPTPELKEIAKSFQSE